MARTMPLLRRMQRLPLIYIDVPALRPGTIGAYAFAVLIAAIATVLRVAIDPYIVGSTFMTAYPAVVIVSLISGFGAGVFCAALTAAAAAFFMVSPRFLST
jgi:K+-sensing histidine kinase KdpD